MTDNKVNSYTAANALPIKIFKNARLTDCLTNGFIPPYHVQLIPTNKCNLNCSFCSCKKRNKQDELPFDKMEKLIATLSNIGCKAVTITGGGEPLMYPKITELLECCNKHEIKIGLVTNGLLLHRLTSTELDRITWCRVSCCDERSFDPSEDILEDAIKNGKYVNWAFSYVIGKEFNPMNLNKYIDFANKHNFTHVRVVSDLCGLESCPDMSCIKSKVVVPDNLVIYQGRKEYDPGQRNCWISLLKPVIGADGKIYPCCGVQYAHESQDLDLPESMCMGTIDDLSYEKYLNMKPFNGLQCDRCYYKNYNDILDQMMEPTEHLEFV